MGTQALTFGDLDLSGIPDIVLKDGLWRRCISLALQGGSKNQRWGALVIVEGEIVGEDRNRLLSRGELPRQRSIFAHAERNAIGRTLQVRDASTIRGGIVHVAGFLVQERRPLVRRGKVLGATCSNCSELYPELGLSVAFISDTGWVVVPGAQAYAVALENSARLKDARMPVREHRKRISL